MEKITSFTINHLVLEPGIYVSRVDHYDGAAITTFDLRMTAPNREPVMNTAEMHTIEHLGATYLRNSPEWKDRIVYFGPMGCRTGFYLLMRDTPDLEVYRLVKSVLQEILDYDGPVFGARRKECGNYRSLNLCSAKRECQSYLKVLEGAVPDFTYREACK